MRSMMNCQFILRDESGDRNALRYCSRTTKRQKSREKQRKENVIACPFRQEIEPASGNPYLWRLFRHTCARAGYLLARILRHAIKHAVDPLDRCKTNSCLLYCIVQQIGYTVHRAKSKRAVSSFSRFLRLRGRILTMMGNEKESECVSSNITERQTEKLRSKDDRNRIEKSGNRRF